MDNWTWSHSCLPFKVMLTSTNLFQPQSCFDPELWNLVLHCLIKWLLFSLLFRFQTFCPDLFKHWLESILEFIIAAHFKVYPISRSNYGLWWWWCLNWKWPLIDALCILMMLLKFLAAHLLCRCYTKSCYRKCRIRWYVVVCCISTIVWNRWFVSMNLLYLILC